MEAGKALRPGYWVGKSLYGKLEKQAGINTAETRTTIYSRGMSIK
jgi:hypothetical protein